MTIRNAASMGSYGASWTSAGYSGSGNVQELLGSLRGRTAVVCGNAASVFEDLSKVNPSLDPVIFAANDIGMFLPKLDHWVSLHVDQFPIWKPVRWMHSKSMESTKYHSTDPKPFIDYAWEQITPCMALSGYFTMQIAYLMGADRIILCGCPGSQERRFFDLHVREDFGYGSLPNDGGLQEQVIKEMQRLPEFRERVRSMSGWTRDFFGGI